MSLRIVVPKGRKLADDFDMLGKRFAEVLHELLPGIEVVLVYRQKDDLEERRFPSPATMSDLSMSVTVTYPVPGEPNWKRTLNVSTKEESREFFEDELGFSGLHEKLFDLANHPDLEHPQHPSNMQPGGLAFSVFLGLDLVGGWEGHTGLHSETRAALARQFPLWFLAHLIASSWHYPYFPTKDKKHSELAATITKVIQYLEMLARTRVEHQDLSHGVVIVPSQPTRKSPKTGKYPDNFHLKRTALLTDGVRAALLISPKGEVVGLITPQQLQKGRKGPIVDRNFFGPLGFLSAASKHLSGISFGLRGDGSIVIFANGVPLFVQRGGKWRGMLWRRVREVLSRKFGNVGTIVFDAATILSITGHGGVFAILGKIPQGIHKKDRVDIARTSVLKRGLSPIDPEWRFHLLLPSDDVLDLGSSFLSTLGAIDGATLISREGKLIAYGAVVPSRPSGAEGARSAAARQLSVSGFVIKVSSDGPLTYYENGKEVFES